MFKEQASRSRINRIDNQNWVRRLKSCPLVKLFARGWLSGCTGPDRKRNISNSSSHFGTSWKYTSPSPLLLPIRISAVTKILVLVVELLKSAICNVIIVNFVMFSFSLIISPPTIRSSRDRVLLLQKSNTIIERELFKYSEHLAPHNKGLFGHPRNSTTRPRGKRSTDQGSHN